jgi:hypothetical protein
MKAHRGLPWRQGEAGRSVCVTPYTCFHICTNFPWEPESQQRLREGNLIIKAAMDSFFIFRLQTKDTSTNTILFNSFYFINFTL